MTTHPQRRTGKPSTGTNIGVGLIAALTVGALLSNAPHAGLVVLLILACVAVGVAARHRRALPNGRPPSIAQLQADHPDVLEHTVIARARRSHNVQHAERTGGTKDRGRDGHIELTNGDRWLVQCKRLQSGYNVGGATVRETAGAMAQLRYDRAVIVTTSGFTGEAHHAARELRGRIRLVTGLDLEHILNGGRAPWESPAYTAPGEGV